MGLKELTCSRAHPECKQIEVRSLKHIQCDVLEADLICVNIDRECTDVNLVVRQYDASLSSLLDKHAPSKCIYVVERPMTYDLSWRSGKRPRLRARRVKVRFSLRAIILSLENLNVIIRAIN